MCELLLFVSCKCCGLIVISLGVIGSLKASLLLGVVGPRSVELLEHVWAVPEKVP